MECRKNWVMMFMPGRPQKPTNCNTVYCRITCRRTSEKQFANIRNKCNNVAFWNQYFVQSAITVNHSREKFLRGHGYLCSTALSLSPVALPFYYFPPPFANRKANGNTHRNVLYHKSDKRAKEKNPGVQRGAETASWSRDRSARPYPIIEGRRHIRFCFSLAQRNFTDKTAFHNARPAARQALRAASG